MSKGSNQRKHRMRFPEKLMDALDHGTYADCIQWSRDGLSFEIINPVATEKRLLKEVFNGEKLHSFIRKIYKWGFVARPATTGDRNAWKAFSYPSMFQRGKRELCRQMRRGGVRVEEPHLTKSSSKQNKTTENESLSSNTTNIVCSFLNWEAPSYFKDFTPLFHSDSFPVDPVSPSLPSTYDMNEDIDFDDDTKDLLCYAFDNGIFD